MMPEILKEINLSVLNYLSFTIRAEEGDRVYLLYLASGSATAEDSERG